MPAAGVPAGTSALRRRELGGFLRSRRERISPDQAGLPKGTRRRTPGLRREEVASLAGVGVTWYTWLEQGRDIRVSEQVLAAVARTLLLDPHEREHLFRLAGSPGSGPPADGQVVAPPVLRLLDKLHPYPACVTNGRFDLLAYNRAYTALVGDVDALPFGERNTLWLMFMSPALRAAVVDRDEAVRRMVGLYRAAMAEHVGEPTWKCLVTRLHQASPEFADLWAHHDVAGPETVTKRFLHPELGLLRFAYTSLWLGPTEGMRLGSYTPADLRTEHAVRRLDTIRPRPLLAPTPVALAGR